MRYLIGLGSNVGDRLAALRAAVGKLGDLGTLEAVSGVYETPPWGYPDQPDYYNAVVALESDLEPVDLLAELQKIELSLGKATPFRYGPRTLDLDILLAEDLALESEALTIPHPRLHQRGFVLAPLAEIAPLAIHPVQSVTIENLLGRLPPGEPLGERVWGPGVLLAA